MEFPVDRKSPIPYYVQVKDAIQEHIDDHTWKPGQQLPGEHELCRMFNVSRTVVRQALNDLAYKGTIVRERSKGTFVAEPKIMESLVQKLTGFYQDMLAQGYTPVTQVLKQELTRANRKVASLLKIEPGTEVIEIERLRFVAKETIQLTTTFIQFSVCSELLNEDLSNQSLYAFLEKQCEIMIARGHRSVEAVPANEYEAQLLGVKKGAPLIRLESVSFQSDGTPVEYYHAVHRGDRTRFEVELVRLREPAEKGLDEKLKYIPLDDGLVFHLEHKKGH